MRLGSSLGISLDRVESLWNERNAAGLFKSGAFDPDARFDAKLGYGLDGISSLLTPYGGMDDQFRSSKAHHMDIVRVVDFLVSEGVREVFLIGTSRGTVSVGYLASVMKHANVKGYVLTASMADIVFYAEKIENPALMVHHTDDECRVTGYTDAVASYRTITRSHRKSFVTVSGGDTPQVSNPCRALTAHGFLGVERETVAAIVDWMNGKAPPRHVNR